MIRSLALTLLLLPTAASAQDLAITHAEAWTMSGTGKVSDATVVVHDGRIVSVSAGGAVPANATVIDAGGRMVTPGLMNAATQLGLVETGSADETNDKSSSNTTLGASFDIQYALNSNSVLLPVARADGLTRAVSYPGAAGTAPFMGQAATIHLTETGDILERPQVAMYVQIGSATLSAAGGSRSAQWQLLRNALTEAGRYQAGKPDQPISRLDAEALQKVLKGQLLVILTQRESDIRQAIALAKDFRLRVAVMGADEAWRCADALAAAKIPVILDPMDNLPISFDQIGARLDNAAILGKAGVRMAFYASGNTIYLSYDAGEAMREVAGLAVANGLPYDQALAAMTQGPATIFGLSDHYGTLAKDQDADLVIWDGDPLEPGTYPWKVFVQGREASLETRQTLLRDRYAKPAALPPVYQK
ncbi:amidohydrolase family protein [Asticcacaulis taihuensis]|jgi:imidazolonepropionase-like amidohydrolase|uniref:amidohydrolase family protein n=1 Tax=Asticcacaulis taihuensis TaxID=260084 RepID=UPI0026E986C0|nr:amidohydrolase family protein [Asticcacaulis taihuensis]